WRYGNGIWLRARVFKLTGTGDGLNDYLEKIRKGEPVNYTAFLKSLPEPYRRSHREMFSTQKVSANRWRVTVEDEAAFVELAAMATIPASRVEAARQGDSHRHTTGVSFILAYHEASPGPRPDTLVIAGDDVTIGFQPAADALVIENEQNFYHYRQMLDFARSEEHTSELQSRENLVCRLLLEKKH